MESKAIFSILLIISSCSWFFHDQIRVLCEPTPNLDQLIPGLGGQEVLKDAQCMQKLLPCQQFLKDPSNPTPACCAPLEQMQENETECLCNFVNNPKFLQSVNVSKDDAMKIPDACGIKVDVSKCKTATSADAGTSQTASSSEGEGTVSEGSKDSTSSTNMITPNGINYFGVTGFIALMSALVFSVY